MTVERSKDWPDESTVGGTDFLAVSPLRTARVAGLCTKRTGSLLWEPFAFDFSPRL
mgnify:CR=1 FL=1